MNDISYSQSFSVYQPKDEHALPIPVSEWRRLKKWIAQTRPGRRICLNLSCTSFGVSGSAFLSLVPFSDPKASLPPWVLPAIWCFLLSTLALGIVLLCMDGLQRHLTTISTDLVLEEMKNIEDRYQIEK